MQALKIHTFFKYIVEKFLGIFYQKIRFHVSLIAFVAG